MGRTPPGETREKIFEFVRDRLLAGNPPTVREVQETFGFKAVQTARQHLEALVAEGRLVGAAGRSRGYRLPEELPSTPMSWVPLLGRVQAGSLTTAAEDLEEYIPVTIGAGDDLFALRVQGESMIDAGILPHDIVIVRQQQTARDGEIVVALIGDEATVKTLRLRNRRVELHPENATFEPIIPDDPSSVIILGKVIELRRNL